MERYPWDEHPRQSRSVTLLTGTTIDWSHQAWVQPEQLFGLLADLGVELHEAQQDAYRKRVGYRVAYYLCGRRWGKTVMGAVEALRHILMHPRARILYMAAHLDQLDEGLGYIRHILESLSVKARIPFKDNSRSTRAPKMEFGDATLYPSVFLKEGKLRGRGYTAAIIDEAELMDASVFEFAILPALGERRGEIVLLSTPRGQTYLLDYCKSVGGIILNYPTWTNPMFPREELELAWRTWNRSVFEQEFGAQVVEVAGRYFQQNPVVVQSLPEEALLHAVGLDWGIEDPFAAVWVAKSAQGVYYVYRELYQRNLTPESQARMVREHLTGQEAVVADPSVWREAPISIAQLWFEAGLPHIHQGTRDRIGSLALIRQLLAQERIRVVDGTAPNLLHELVEAKVSSKRVEDFVGEDHAIDALRYAIAHLHSQSLHTRTSPPRDTIAEWEWRAQRYEGLLSARRW